MRLRVAGFVAVAAAVAALLATDARLAQGAWIGGVWVAAASWTMPAAAVAVALPALLRRPLVPLLLTTTPVLAFVFAGIGYADWAHVLHASDPAPAAPHPAALAAALLLPAGILLAHADGRGPGGWVPAGQAAGLALPVAAVALLPALPDPGLLAAGAIVALSVAAAIALATRGHGAAARPLARRDAAGSTSRRGRRRGRAP